MYHCLISGAANTDLTTAQLAELTAISPATLRMWESRYGFPAPARLPGGHRRYSERDVALVREVVRLRDEGLSLTAAIERARTSRPPGAASVFAGLRRRRPDVAPMLLPKAAVLALSRALEDEYCAHGADGLLIGSFQHERFYRRSERRWRELARTARLTVVLADFARPTGSPPTGRPAAGAPVEVPIGDHGPLAREWAVVISAEGSQACLAAWEQPAESALPDPLRRFEVLWSFDPAVVADAVAVCAELLEPLAPDIARRVAEHELAHQPAEPVLRYGGALTHRMVGYLGQMLGTELAAG